MHLPARSHLFYYWKTSPCLVLNNLHVARPDLLDRAKIKHLLPNAATPRVVTPACPVQICLPQASADQESPS